MQVLVQQILVGAWVCISNRIPGQAAAAGSTIRLKVMLWTTLSAGLIPWSLSDRKSEILSLRNEEQFNLIFYQIDGIFTQALMSL